MRIKTCAFHYQAAVNQRGIRHHQGFIVEANGKTGDTAMAGRAPIGITHFIKICAWKLKSRCVQVDVVAFVVRVLHGARKIDGTLFTQGLE